MLPFMVFIQHARPGPLLGMLPGANRENYKVMFLEGTSRVDIVIWQSREVMLPKMVEVLCAISVAFALRTPARVFIIRFLI